jgi:hypothetical protein
MYDVILSGRITGYADYRLKFAQAVVKVKTVFPGACVWNPAELPEGREYAWYMRQCLMAIMEDAKPTCVLVMLKGWNRSKGAVAEWAVARCLGMPVVKLLEL